MPKRKPGVHPTYYSVFLDKSVLYSLAWTIQHVFPTSLIISLCSQPNTIINRVAISTALKVPWIGSSQRALSKFMAKAPVIYAEKPMVAVATVANMLTTSSSFCDVSRRRDSCTAIRVHICVYHGEITNTSRTYTYTCIYTHIYIYIHIYKQY